MRRSLLVLCALAAFGVIACGDDPSVGDERADQARQAALDAGLPADVADFLATAARGVDATYQVTYPSSEASDDVVVASDPPNLRVDVVRDGEAIRTDLTTEDGSLHCERADADSPLTCRSTSVVLRVPNRFSDETVADLTDSLRGRLEDFTFEVTTEEILGVDATCLVTRVRADRDRPELSSGATMCVSDQGVLLRLDSNGETVEAREYATTVADNTFVRPDRETG